jgi:hypothetical protein
VDCCEGTAVCDVEQLSLVCCKGCDFCPVGMVACAALQYINRCGRVMDGVGCVVACFHVLNRIMSGHLCVVDDVFVLSTPVGPGGAFSARSCTVFSTLYVEKWMCRMVVGWPQLS